MRRPASACGRPMTGTVGSGDLSVVSFVQKPVALPPVTAPMPPATQRLAARARRLIGHRVIVVRLWLSGVARSLAGADALT